MEWTIEIVLVMLLGATLYQAIRLERALTLMKRDRASLDSLVTGFNASTNQAESGIQQLRAAIEVQVAKSMSLKDDLAFLTERGDRLADRLDGLVRNARPLVQDRVAADRPSPEKHSVTKPGSGEAANQVERDVLQALRMAR